MLVSGRTGCGLLLRLCCTSEILNFVLHYIYSTAVSYFTDNVIVYRNYECIKYDVLVYHNKTLTGVSELQTQHSTQTKNLFPVVEYFLHAGSVGPARLGPHYKHEATAGTIQTDDEQRQ